MLSIGTLGGGNHFIEVNKDKDGNLYLVIHSGSRNLGKQVAEYYQGLAYKELSGVTQQKQSTIKKLKQQGRENEIESELKNIQPSKVNKELAYLQGEDFYNYINDMAIVQQYAEQNRKAMAFEIMTGIGCFTKDQFTTIHNYIETKTMILRKGAISAKEGEKVIIPLNMRDGSIIAIGKGNADWNYSAPHGAGRLMSRSRAKRELLLEDFKESMNGIYTTSVNESTLDECPMAYKPINSILDNVSDTIEIVNIVKPIYNFKAV
jgi:RNA-splicing ligase RtcB